ncbi:MAG: DUF4132 domain-containing protein [Myxococcales bacterium]|nr:DUF4132 domain-containing protein [Myxococcales bacterium]
MTKQTSDILSIIERFKDDYRLDEKLRAVLGGKDEAYLARFLWESFRDYNIDLGEHRELWRRLYYDNTAFSAEDFLRLIKNINKHFPDAMYRTQYGSLYSIHSEDEPPGYFNGLREIIEVKQGDKAFAEEMKEEWIDLPNPYRVGVGYALAQFGLINYTEIPAEIADQIALKHLQHGADTEKYWTRPHAYPPEVWGPILVETALKHDDLAYEQAIVVKDMVPYTSGPEQVLQLLSKCSNYFYYSKDISSVGDMLEKDAIPVFEKLLQSTTVEPLPSESRERWPHFSYASVYLRLCQRFEHAPPKSLDGFFQGFLEHYKPGWSGGGLQEFVESFQKLLQQIPAERLEKMLLKTSKPKWYWLPACSTPKILQFITDQIALFSSNPDYEDGQTIENISGRRYCDFQKGLLSPVHKELIPYFTKALEKTNCPQRKLYVDVLASSNSSETIVGLVSALQDSAKGIRQVAQEALSRLAPEELLPHLAPLLEAKRKDTRLIVASILAELPPHQAVYDLAQVALPKEKVKEIEALLSQIEAPRQDNLNKKDEAVVVDLKENDGTTWQTHIALGPKLIPLYWRFMEGRFFETYISTYGDAYEGWVALLKHFKESPEAVEHAALCVPAFDRWDGKTFLPEIYDDFPTLLDAIKARIQEGSYQRPKTMGKYSSSFDAEHTIDWFIEKQPQQMLDVLVERLQDKRKNVRRSAANSLSALGESVFDLLVPLLEDKKIDPRCEAIELIGQLKTPKALKALRDALKKEKSARAIELLRSTIAVLEAEQLDASDFPETSEGNQDLEKALGKLTPPPLPSPLQGATLPSIQWKTGGKVSPAAQAWIVAELAQENYQRRSTLLRGIRPRLEDDGCHALSAAMVAKGPRFDDGWPLYVQSVIGSPEQIDAIAASLDRLSSSRSTNWGDDGVEALARYGSDAAIRYLDHAHRKGKRDALKGRAGRGLRQLASEREQTIEELVESAISDMGFDMSGKLCLSYGPRTFFVQLHPDFSIELTDEHGKVLKAAPSIRKDDDEDLAEKSRKTFSAVKKQLKQIHKAQILRLEASLRSDRRWGVEEWKARFLGHPLFYQLGKNLIWETLGKDEKPLKSFLIQDDLSLKSADNKAYKLPNQGHVRLLHPINLSSKERDAWSKQLEAQGIEQPFPQLQRECFVSKDLPKEDKAWLAQLPAVGSLSFINALAKTGYERGPREDAGLIFSSYGKIGSYNINLSHGGWYPEVMDDDGDVDLRGVSVSDEEGKSINWRELPPVFFSEIVRDLHRLTAAGTK